MGESMFRVRAVNPPDSNTSFYVLQVFDPKSFIERFSQIEVVKFTGRQTQQVAERGRK